MTTAKTPTILNDALNAEGLCVVHVTRYLPTTNPDGSLGINSSYTATNGELARNTVHFTLNHMVESHGGGTWSDTTYAVIAPFQGMLDENGPPPAFRPVDTYWTTNAHEPLRIPNATLVMPDETLDTLTSKTGNVVTYKTKDFTADDEAVLCKACGDRYIDNMSWENISSITDSKKRDRVLSELAHKYAIKQTIDALGFQHEAANEHGWERSDYTPDHAQNFALSIGAKDSTPHRYSDYRALSAEMEKEIDLVNYLEARVGINGKSFKEENGYVFMSDKNGGDLHYGEKSSFDARAARYQKDGFEKSLSHLVAIARPLDTNTREVVRDFREKTAQSMSAAIQMAADQQAIPLPEQVRPTSLPPSPQSAKTAATLGNRSVFAT